MEGNGGSSRRGGLVGKVGSWLTLLLVSVWSLAGEPEPVFESSGSELSMGASAVQALLILGALMFVGFAVYNLVMLGVKKGSRG